MAVLDSMDDMSIRRFGITIHIETDKEKRAFLERDIERSIQTQELRLEDAIRVRNIADQDVKLAEQYLILRREKYQKEKMQEMQAAQEMQSQSNAQAAQVKMQADQQLMAMELQMFQQKEAIRLQGLQMEKMIQAGIDSKMSTQEFYQDLQLKQMDEQGKASQVANQNQMAFAKIDFQDQKQKENIVLRDQMGSKQNDSKPNNV